MRELKEKLDRIGAIISGWEARGGADELERDLVLELLREVYAEIKWDAAPNGEAEPAVAGAAVAIGAVSGPEGEDCQVLGFLEEPVTEAAAPAPEPEYAPEPEPSTEPELEPEPTTEPEPKPEPEATIEPESASNPEPAAEPEFIPIIPRPVAPEVIRSLYGSDAENEKAPEPSGRKPQSARRSENISEPSPEPVEKSGATLGDAMSAGHRTLGESLRTGERDMASRLAAAGRPGLKRSIGLNDRFLMIRDMFDGDADAFDRAVTKLDAFTDLDEAVIWIRENFDWSADSRGAALLVGLLERKLGR